jgi:hypothetical protein
MDGLPFFFLLPGHDDHGHLPAGLRDFVHLRLERRDERLAQDPVVVDDQDLFSPGTWVFGIAKISP